MLYGILSVAAAAVLAGIDQWIKAWATANLLPVGAMPLIPGIVELRYSLNQGMAFSLLWGRQGFLIAVTSIALLAVAVYLFWKRPPLAERIAWTMVLGGGVGNLIDRIVSGQVVDYINLLFVDFRHLQLCRYLRHRRHRAAVCGHPGRRAAGTPGPQRAGCRHKTEGGPRPRCRRLSLPPRRRLPASGWTAFWPTPAAA